MSILRRRWQRHRRGCRQWCNYCLFFMEQIAGGRPSWVVLFSPFQLATHLAQAKNCSTYTDNPGTMRDGNVCCPRKTPSELYSPDSNTKTWIVRVSVLAIQNSWIPARAYFSYLVIRS